MGRHVNEAVITTRNARSKLPPRKAPYWRAIDRGAHLGYRKGADGGTWIVRWRKPNRSYVTKALGSADDALEADGTAILDYSQALDGARAWCEAQTSPASRGPYSVGDAVRHYLDGDVSHTRAFQETQRVAECEIIPTIGEIELSTLDAGTIRKWHSHLAERAPKTRTGRGQPQRYRSQPSDPEGIRRRRSTANRALTVLKATLNFAYREGHAVSNGAWRRVKPFANVDAPRVRFLSTDEAVRLINACRPDFRAPVRAALYTGARYGELTAMEVSDLNSESRTLLVRFTKTGKPRHIALTDEGHEFFVRLTAGRAPNEPMFLRADGRRWTKSQQTRPLAGACAIAKIDPPIGFHILRHTIGSWLAMRGVPLQVIAETLGHDDTRITSRHYAALSPGYVAETVRANLPDLGIDDDNVVRLEQGN